MIRVAKLVVSRPMYAFKPETWRPAPSGYGFEVDAVWFKRKDGRNVAMIGTYHPMVERRDQQPDDGEYATWLAAANDNRYGGTWLHMWDGLSSTPCNSTVPLETATARHEFLRIMLDNFPNVPAGYDGWWTFPRPGKAKPC